MSCQDIVSQPPATLSKGDTVAQAVASLVMNRFHPLPVVDAKGHFVGMFGPKEVMALMLPRAARLGEDLGDLNFCSDSAEDLKARLGSHAGEPVSKYCSPHRVISASTALCEVLLLLHRGDNLLPVVDGSGTLVGIVTAADALARIAEHG